MGGALLRFRVMAWTVGVFLLLLVFVGVPLKYLADSSTLVAILGPVHGFLYILYVIVAFDLTAVRLRWPFLRWVLVLLAGTIPLMSFVAEHRVTARVRERTNEVAPART